MWCMLICVGIYALTHILLSINSIQSKIADFSKEFLSSYLESNVEIDKIRISPFNKVFINNIVIYDLKNDTLLYAKECNASIKLSDLLDNKITLNSVSVCDFIINTNKDSVNSPINAKFLIDKLKPKKKREKDIPKISVNTLLLQNGAFRYNIFSSPCKEKGVFDKNHVSIENILINASLKGYTKDSVNVNVRALRLMEKSGFTVKNIAFKLIGNSESVKLKNFSFASKNSNVFIKENEITMPKDMNFKEFMDLAEFKFELDNSEIVLSDFSPFVPKLKDFHSPTNVTCKNRRKIMVMLFLKIFLLTVLFRMEYGLQEL